MIALAYQKKRTNSANIKTEKYNYGWDYCIPRVTRLRLGGWKGEGEGKEMPPWNWWPSHARHKKGGHASDTQKATAEVIDLHKMIFMGSFIYRTKLRNGCIIYVTYYFHPFPLGHCGDATNGWMNACMHLQWASGRLPEILMIKTKKVGLGLVKNPRWRTLFDLVTGDHPTYFCPSLFYKC